MTLRLLDLFSGFGGFSLGLEADADFRTVAMCEVNPACRAVLRSNWPGVPIYEDIQTLTAEQLRRDGIEIDAICGGFPCQDVSKAFTTGGGLGLAGSRSGLWRHYARLIGELRPKVVFVENVSALLSRGLGGVLGDLATLGYDAWWDCIPAAFVGAPHRRDRIWIVAYPSGEGRQGPQPFRRALERAIAAFAKHDDPFADARRALDGDFTGLRTGDALSVNMERRRLHGLGNAVCTGVPRLLGTAFSAAI